ncbi:hypothetical protein ACR79T_10175 [Sphingobacterium spiritivorum]|uniref:hypothetical protein n=1 Tax=Sphingobacterium spiritivorum TaxID=258 RepID=UPI003DA39C6E
MSKPIKHPNISLTEEEWEKLETLSGLGYSTDKIAVYFGLDKRIFNQIASDKDSFLSERLEAGRIKQDIDERYALYDAAKDGDIPAQKQIYEIKRTRAFKISKLDIFGSFDSKKILDQLNNYIQSGGKLDVSVEEQLYIDTLLFMRDMDTQYGRRATVDFFVKHFKLKHQRASEMYDESMNLFYRDREVNKKALRHKYADRLEMAATVVASNAETARDWEVYGNLTKQASTLLELDKPDVEKMPKELYLPPVKVYTLDAEEVGLPAINRNDLAAEIDALDQPESVKKSLRQDALLDPVNLIDKFDRIEREHKN